MPLKLKQRDDSGKSGDVKEHPLASIFDGFANPETTFKDFLQWVLIDYFTANAGIAVITRDENQNITGLWQQHAKKVSPQRSPETNWDLVYNITLDCGDVVPFSSSEILKIVNFYNTGVLGNNIVDLAQNSFQMANATVKFAKEFFDKGIYADGFIQLGDTIGADEISAAVKTEIENDLAAKYSGTGNYHKPIILPGGTKWEQVQMDLQKLQAVETRKFNRESICSIFRVINRLMTGETTSAEAWQSQIKLLLGDISKIENSFKCWLLTEDERRAGLYVKFNVDALTRGDLSSRMSAHATALNNGIETVNEVREIEDLPRVEGGDELRQNSAIQSLDHSKQAGGRNENSNGTDSNGKVLNGDEN